jgi:hypothetical protein
MVCRRPVADLQLQLANEREAQESGHRLHPQTQAAKSQNVRGFIALPLSLIKFC